MARQETFKHKNFLCPLTSLPHCALCIGIMPGQTSPLAEIAAQPRRAASRQLLKR